MLRAPPSAQNGLMAAKNSGAPEVVGSNPATGMSFQVSKYIWGFPVDMRKAPRRPPGTSLSEWAKVHGRFPEEDHPRGRGCTTPRKKDSTLKEEAEARRQRMKVDDD